MATQEEEKVPSKRLQMQLTARGWSIALAIAAIAGVHHWVRSRLTAGLIITVLLVATISSGLRYLNNFVRDVSHRNTRAVGGQWVDSLANGYPATIAVWAEPAPYAVPPVNLFRNRLLLLPPGYVPSETQVTADIFIQAVDSRPRERESWSRNFARQVILRGQPSPLSWADKPFVIDAVPTPAEPVGK